MNFQIMQAEGRKFVPLPGEIYDDADKAAKIAAQMAKQQGCKFKIRPCASAVDWHDRERKRFKSGEYKPVIWVKEKWWKEIEGHFAHIGVKDKTRIAFTPDAEKGAADRQTAMLPGKYLQQFFGDVLTAEQIRDYAMEHNVEFENKELKFATTPEDIERVYKPRIGGSCFSGTTQANLYGSGDFAVAYIEDEKGNITARALCALKPKVYPHPYGDTYRLNSLLGKAGYKLNGNGKPYVGLRLLKKWFWPGFYPDWSYYGQEFVADPNDEQFLIVKAIQ